ncbi:MAG: hypothetical protein E4H02_07095 [Lentisphaerales bacterium]|nr:MAG: hypothetical protein E4H02_07095 [Lentisphaerales bacterium]
MKATLYAAVALTSIVLCGCSLGRPTKPGPDAVWVPTYVVKDGTIVPGHWVYAGPSVDGKVWQPGQFGPDAKWIDGYWRKPYRPDHSSTDTDSK